MSQMSNDVLVKRHHLVVLVLAVHCLHNSIYIGLFLLLSPLINNIPSAQYKPISCDRKFISEIANYDLFINLAF